MHISKGCLMKRPHFDEIFDEYYAAGQRLKEFVTDTAKILDDAFVADEKFYLKVHKGYVRYRPWYISFVTSIILCR